MSISVGKSRLSYLAHASHRDAAEGSEHVGLDTRGGLKHKDTTGTKQIHWNLTGKHRTETLRNKSTKGNLGLVEVSLKSSTLFKIMKCWKYFLQVTLFTLGLISMVRKSLKLA